MSASNKSTNKGLGRGIESLLPQDFDKNLLVNETERIQKVPINSIEARSDQPRVTFDPKTIDELAQSIKQYGVLQPLIVMGGDKEDHYIIIAGERRWRAAKKVGLKVLPVIVRSAKELEKLEISLIENIQRVDLSPLEQAASIERLRTIFKQTDKEIGLRLGKARSTIKNLANLLNLPEEAKKALNSNKITEGHARTIMSLQGEPDKQAELLKSIVRNHWSVRQAERFVIAAKKQGVDVKTAHARVKTESPATRSLSKKIEAPVTIRRMAKGGKLEIGFTSEEDLERIIKIISKKA